MGDEFYTDAFADDIAQLRDPAWTEPTSQQVAKIDDEVDDLATNLADQISTRVRDLPDSAPYDAHRVVRDAGDWQLARLRALREIRTAAESLAERTVAAAGTRGAGYPQLGTAWDISRQGARKKWPGVVAMTSMPPAGQELRTTINAFGGTADLSWHADEGGWWWIGQGADGMGGDAGEDVTYDSKEEAAANAGAFLKEHALTDGATK